MARWLHVGGAVSRLLRRLSGALAGHGVNGGLDGFGLFGLREAMRNGAVALARGLLIAGPCRLCWCGGRGRIQLPMLRHVEVDPPRDLVRVPWRVYRSHGAAEWPVSSCACAPAMWRTAGGGGPPQSGRGSPTRKPPCGRRAAAAVMQGWQAYGLIARMMGTPIRSVGERGRALPSPPASTRAMNRPPKAAAASMTYSVKKRGKPWHT